MELTNWFLLSLPALIHRWTVMLCAKRTYRKAMKKCVSMQCISSFFTEHKTYMCLLVIIWKTGKKSNAKIILKYVNSFELGIIMNYYQSTTLWSSKDNIEVIFINHCFLLCWHNEHNELAPFHVDHAVEEWIFPLDVTKYWMVVWLSFD